MNCVYIKEAYGYTAQEFNSIFDFISEDVSKREIIVSNIKDKLKKYSVLKVSKPAEKDMSDLSDETIIIDSNDISETEKRYSFSFVGIFYVNGMIFKCLPKYIKTIEPVKKTGNDKINDNKLKKVLKVIRKYEENKNRKLNRSETIPLLSELDENGNFNKLSVILSLMFDFFENGLYRNFEEIFEENGNGEIHWDKTINTYVPYLSYGVPFYPYMKTKKSRINNNDFFTVLHELVLGQAYKELAELDLLDVLDIPNADFRNDGLDVLGDTDYIKSRIYGELSYQFRTREQNVLKMILNYLSYEKSLTDIESVCFYGTNSFNLVWEDVCRNVFDDCLQKEIESICDINKLLEYKNKIKLTDIIENPYWKSAFKTDGGTFIPDIITIKNNIFYILDAKYYIPEIELGNVKRPPGIESISKQYFYQLAYKKFTEDMKFDRVVNCFLFPTDEEKVICKKSVHMDMFSVLGLEDIKLRYLPADKMYDYYLEGKILNVLDRNYKLCCCNYCEKYNCNT